MENNQAQPEYPNERYGDTCYCDGCGGTSEQPYWEAGETMDVEGSTCNNCGGTYQSIMKMVGR